jgi:hypothetical protein
MSRSSKKYVYIALEQVHAHLRQMRYPLLGTCHLREERTHEVRYL